MKSDLRSELVFDEELENRPPEVQVLVRKPRVKKVKEVVQEPVESTQNDSQSDSDNLDELEQKLSEKVWTLE